MNTTRHMSLEVELIRWFLLFVAAIATLLAIATALGAADSVKAPRLLPPGIAAMAKPMTPPVARPYFPEFPPGTMFPPAEAADRLWTTLDNQRAGCYAEALEGWEQIGLAEKMAHWRLIGMGAAYLHSGDLRRAELHLNMARQLDPDNAVVAYLSGLLRMEQAFEAGRVPDGYRGRAERLVAYRPKEDKLRYQIEAIIELRNAIDWAGEVRLDERLVATEPQIEETVVVPRVGDLLVAIGAHNFVGKAHHLLFGLYLDGRELGAAEHHLDHAAANGIAVLYGYRDLAENYLLEERNGDALRVLRKDLEVNHPELGWLCERVKEIFQPTAVPEWMW